MLGFQSYNPLDDLKWMKTLLSEILPVKPRSTYHPGDMNWRAFVVWAGYSLQERIGLWVDDRDQLKGFLFVYPSAGMFDLVVHPVVSGTDAKSQMLDEAAAYLSSLKLKDRSELSMFVFAEDQNRRALLEAKGYTGNECRVHFAQSLIGHTFEPMLPPGFHFLCRQDETHAEQRANAHVDAFSPGSTMTKEKYHVLMSATDYAPQLDVVVVAPDGRYAAFALG